MLRSLVAECRCGALLFRMLPLFHLMLSTGLDHGAGPVLSPADFPLCCLAVSLSPLTCPPGLRLPFTEVLKLLLDHVRFSYNIKMIDKPSICSDWPSPLTLELHSGKNTFIVNLNQRINYV